MRRPVVAIDGPAGAGKSTIAKNAASALGFIYIDTGAMYRALTLKAIRNGYDLGDAERIGRMARETKLEIVPGAGNAPFRVLLDGEDVSAAIRSQEVSGKITTLSALPAVRDVMRELQRAFGAAGGIVMEGRDIGTTVFPDAECKFYLDASIEERARRRSAELRSAGKAVNEDEIRESIRRRDELDSTRAVAPLRRAPDAMVIDSTGKSIDDVTALIVSKVQSWQKK